MKALVTGGTSGIGRAAAAELVRRGADLFLVARDPARGEAVAAELRGLRSDATVDVLVADVSSQASLRALAAEVRRRTPRLDLLVNNAGGVFMERRTTVDGIEWTFAVNHLGYFLLTNLLLDLIRASAPARIVSTSSKVHHNGRLHWDDLQLEHGYGGMRAYSQSKLCNILFTRELARRLDGSGVTANCLHPGVVRSGFGRNNRGWMGWGVRLIAPFMISPEAGAKTLVYLATSPDVANVSGEYFDKCRIARPSRAARDDEAAARLWQESARLTGVG